MNELWSITTSITINIINLLSYTCKELIKNPIFIILIAIIILSLLIKIIFYMIKKIKTKKNTTKYYNIFGERCSYEEYEEFERNIQMRAEEFVPEEYRKKYKIVKTPNGSYLLKNGKKVKNEFDIDDIDFL